MYNKLVAELVMGRVGYGPSLYGPSWLWAEFVMGRVCYWPRCPVTVRPTEKCFFAHDTFRVNILHFLVLPRRFDISPLYKNAYPCSLCFERRK